MKRLPRYRTILRVMRHDWTYGITLDRAYLRPTFERWSNGEWLAQGFGLSVWRFSRRAVTVADRGAW